MHERWLLAVQEHRWSVVEEQFQLLDNKDYRAITNTSITVKEKRKGGEQGREKNTREKRERIYIRSQAWAKQNVLLFKS